MAFLRRFFRGGEAEAEAVASSGDPPAEGAAPAETPAAPAGDGAVSAAEGRPPAAAPTLADPAPSADSPPPAAPSADDAWWASSTAESDAPATSQSATVSHAPQAAPEPEADESDSPTAPHSLLEIERARAQLADNIAADAAPPAEPEPAAEDDPTAIEGTRQLDEESAPAIVAQRSEQGLAAMAMRDIGRVREINQDSVFAMITSLPREASDLMVGLFIVADGMGGHHGGEVASRLAVRTIVHHVLSQLVLPTFDDQPTEALQPLMVTAVQEANRAIWEHAQGAGSDMGTTCTAALLVGHGLYIAHVGDSRAYLYEPGGLKQLTSDHSTVGRLIQLGQLDPSEAREHPLRNQLYRTIGQQAQVSVDFIYQPVSQSSHLLLCSDGLWGMINERLMEQALRRSPWPQDMCSELIALANLAGGDDNISAVVVTLPMGVR